MQAKMSQPKDDSMSDCAKNGYTGMVFRCNLDGRSRVTWTYHNLDPYWILITSSCSLSYLHTPPTPNWWRAVSSLLYMAYKDGSKFSCNPVIFVQWIFVRSFDMPVMDCLIWSSIICFFLYFSFICWNLDLYYLWCLVFLSRPRH